MKAYRFKICGAVKSKKNDYFKVPDENSVIYMVTWETLLN